ncbi:fatty acid desaturase family protein [Pseudoblastomonas flavescens]|uniref:fatty acid desaturase family protein n=1 Tax=Alteriqipengyuania flavescens TaxID=3053610 RepID=UPI00384AFB63
MNAHRTFSADTAASVDAGAQLRDASAHPRSWHAQMPDDKVMLRAVRDLTKDLGEAKPHVFWPDMLASAAVGYAGMAGAIGLQNGWLALGCAVVSVLAFYRALLFIHELSHIHRNALPGFRLAWNALVGVPMLTPSFMYEGVHTLHHKRTQYGTVEDPEYLPLALMKPWSLPGFVIIAALLPVGLLIRFGILNPLSAIIPPLRQLVWQRASALAINPDFRRRPPEGDIKRRVFWQEIGGTAMALAYFASVPLFGWKPLLTGIAIISAVAVFNQVRTLVAHLWENDGEAMTVTAQYLDSVNVPPPSPFAAIWAPVGLRYHALHHLMPSMPYHDLGECHRRLKAGLDSDSSYHGANHAGLRPLVARLARSTMGGRG